MAHWKQEFETEDASPSLDAEVDQAAQTRQWLRREVSNHPFGVPLADLESLGSHFFLGLDYDSDLDDIDEMGPF